MSSPDGASDDKRRARLDVIAHLLDRMPYEPLEPRHIEPPRRELEGDDDPDRKLPLRHVPSSY